MKTSAFPDFIYRPIPKQRPSGWLQFWRRLRPGAARAGTSLDSLRIRVSRRAVLTVGAKSGAREIRVHCGLIWLTETPATSDVILGTGDVFDLNGGWPIVIEALADAEVELHH